MLDRETAEKLREIGLLGMAQTLAAQERDPEADSLSFAERFGLLVDAEWTCRRNRRLERLLREARLRLPACLEDIDFGPQRGLSRSVARSLGTGRWLQDRQNILVAGPTGVGKTFLACALANAACRLGYSARYCRVPRLVADLTVARGDGSYRRTLAKLARFDLLVLDDLGIAPLSPGECRDLLEIVDDRSQTRSTVVSSQLPIEAWHGTMGDPTLADAILDSQNKSEVEALPDVCSTLVCYLLEVMCYFFSSFFGSVIAGGSSFVHRSSIGTCLGSCFGSFSFFSAIKVPPKPGNGAIITLLQTQTP